MNILKKYNQYIKGTLPKSEDQKLTKKIVKDYFEEEDQKERWKEILKTEHDFSVEKKTTGSKLKKSIVRIITGISIAASMLFAFYLIQNQQSTEITPLEKLLSEHINKTNYRKMQRGSSADLEVRTQAETFYNDKDYESCIPLYEKIIQQEVATEDDYFFLGLSYLYLKKPDLAIKQFDSILNQAGMERKEQATWYLALALIASKDYQRAKIYLNEIMTWKDGGSGRAKLKKDAQDLLQEIDT